MQDQPGGSALDVSLDEPWGDAPVPGLAGEPLIDAEATSPPAPPPAVTPWRRVLLGASLVFIALNLRPVFSSVAALLPEIQQTTGLGASAASLLTTLPVLCLGIFAPFAPVLAGRFGAERTILALLGLLAAGTSVRGLGTVPALLIGAILAGAAIAVVNVLLPGLVKRDYPDRLALMTGLFTMALSAGAAAAAGLTVPLRAALGGSWPLALAIWAMPVLVAVLLWAVVGRGGPARAAFAGGGTARLWRNPIAWQITLFMGAQSAMAYCIFGYLAPILRERGLPAASAGALVSWSVAVQCVAALMAPALAVRCRDQRIVNVAFFIVAVAGFTACVFAPLSLVVLSATVQGFGQGGLIALAMTAIVLRTADARTAAALSSMAQSIGYALASVGPLLLGVLRGQTGSYAASTLLIAALGAVGAVSAYAAGRDRTIATDGTRQGD